MRPYYLLLTARGATNFIVGHTDHNCNVLNVLLLLLENMHPNSSPLTTQHETSCRSLPKICQNNPLVYTFAVNTLLKKAIIYKVSIQHVEDVGETCSKVNFPDLLFTYFDTPVSR